MSQRRRGLLMIVGGLCILGAPLRLLAEPPPVLFAQLEEAQRVLAEQGFVQRGSPRYGVLDEYRETRLALRLQGGRPHILYGVCDADCDDLDLLLSAVDGTELVSDSLPDDTPLIEYTPASDTALILTVRMMACEVEPCGYGIIVLTGNEE